MLLFPAYTGCSCGDGGGSYGPPEGPYGDVLLAICDMIDRCPDGLGYPIAYRDTDECAAILDWAFSCRLTEREVGNDTTLYGVAQSRPDLDDAKAAACIEWLEAAACEDLQRAGEGTPCAEAFAGSGDDDDDDDSGSSAVDQPCSGDYDCLPELYCATTAPDQATGTVYCQVCKPRLVAGSECQQGGRSCAEGLHCRYEENGPRLCAELDPDGTRCTENEQCQTGFCNSTLEELGGWGQCDPGGNEGEPCSEQDEVDGRGSDCRLDLHCDAGACQPKRPNGEPCEDYYDCAVGGCHVETGICGAPDGTACYDHRECADGLCIDSVCGGPEGACVSDDQCAEGEYCPGACRPPNCYCSGNGCPVGTCTPIGEGGGGGEGCEDDEDCPSGECDDGQCMVPKTIGDSCAQSYECYPLGYCENGVCVERREPGDSCTGLDTCLEPFLCLDGRCEIINLACEPASAGELCAYLRVCDEDSYCDLLGGVVCRPRARAGEECSSSPIPGVETCEAGYSCEYDGVSGSRCVARPALGEPCTASCVEGSYCVEGTCQGDPVGRPCDYDLPCPEGLFCDDESCVPLRGQGGECDDLLECQEDLYCLNYQTCEPKLGRGEPCRDPEECQRQLYCNTDSYTCETDLTAGDTCDSRDQPCAEGLYCPNSGIDNTCAEAAGPGDPCSSNEECASGVCYSYSWCQASATCEIP